MKTHSVDVAFLFNLSIYLLFSMLAARPLHLASTCQLGCYR